MMGGGVEMMSGPGDALVDPPPPEADALTRGSRFYGLQIGGPLEMASHIRPEIRIWGLFSGPWLVSYAVFYGVSWRERLGPGPQRKTRAGKGNSCHNASS
jgi:hypothetical protein